jgi:hypothetical protein
VADSKGGERAAAEIDGSGKMEEKTKTETGNVGIRE